VVDEYIENQHFRQYYFTDKIAKQTGLQHIKKDYIESESEIANLSGSHEYLIRTHDKFE